MQWYIEAGNDFNFSFILVWFNSWVAHLTSVQAWIDVQSEVPKLWLFGQVISSITSKGEQAAPLFDIDDA